MTRAELHARVVFAIAFVFVGQLALAQKETPTAEVSAVIHS